MYTAVPELHVIILVLLFRIIGAMNIFFGGLSIVLSLLAEQTHTAELRKRYLRKGIVVFVIGIGLYLLHIYFWSFAGLLWLFYYLYFKKSKIATEEV